MVHVIYLKVFVDEVGNFGDTATIVIDENRQLKAAKRLVITRELRTAETVFINNVEKAEISIMHYDGEIDFAGVAALATAWQISKLIGEPIKTMKGRGGTIQVGLEKGLTWVQANIDTLPPWNFKKVTSIDDIPHFPASESNLLEHTMVWAWEDEAHGRIRARTFARDWGIPEAEGNGSGAMKLATTLGRNLEITHGKGSAIFARPISSNAVEVGGRIAKDRHKYI